MAASAGPEDEHGELLDEELAIRALDPAEPSDHERRGGAGRGLSLILLLGGVVGGWASVMLLLAGRTLAADPDAALACDINPVVGCGDFLLTWQSSVLGVPNALLGAVGFAALAVIGLALLLGARLPRWIWVALALGAVGGTIFTVWFQYQSLAVLRGLCPYCLVVWVVIPPVVVNLVARAAQAGHLGVPERLRRFLITERYLLVVGWYVIVVALVVVTFWSQWSVVW